MEHDLLTVETGVDGLRPRLAVSDIQAASESGEEVEKAGELRMERSREAERKEGREKWWHPKMRGDGAARTNKAALGAEHQSAHH